MLVSRLESASRNNVDSDAQKFLKILEQADVVKKGRTRLKIDEQVKITARLRLSPGD